MTYEQQFLTARKVFETKIKPLSPSKKLIKATEDEKPKTLAAKLDHLEGKKFAEMNSVVMGFEGCRIVYLRKLDAVIAKEPHPDKLRPLVKPLGEAMEDILEKVEKIAEAQRQEEAAAAAKLRAEAEAKEKAKQKAKQGAQKPGGGPGGNPNLPSALKGTLGKITDEYRKRGQKQLQVSITVENYCLNIRKQVGALHETIHKEVAQAQDLSRRGQLRAAGPLKAAGQNQLNKMKTLTEQGAKQFNAALKLYNRQHLLTAEDVAKELRINVPPTVKGELERITKANAKVFLNATEHSTEARHYLEDCVKLIAAAGPLATQISAIVDGKVAG